MNKIYNYGIKLYRGRLDRKHFLGGLFIIILMGALIGLLTIALVLINTSGPIIFLFLVLSFYVCLNLKFSLIVRRLHDIGNDGMFSILVLFPFVNVILILYLLLKKGTAEANQYGNVSQKKFMEDIFLLSFWKKS